MACVGTLTVVVVLMMGHVGSISANPSALHQQQASCGAAKEVIYGSNNIVQTTVPSQDACCELCLANSSCVAFTFAPGAEASALNCWLKDNTAGPYPSHDGHVSALVGRSAAATIAVADQFSFKVEAEYASYTIDTSRNRAFFDVNLNNTYLQYMAQQLSPAILRVGGSGGDVLTYDVPAGTASACVPSTSCPNAAAPDASSDGTMCCLNQSTWAALCNFATNTNAKLVFALNRHLDLNGPEVTGLLHDAIARKCPIWGFELGNEYGVPVDGGNFGDLYKLVCKLWPDEATRPVLIGPDADQNQHPGEQIGQFLNALAAQNVPLHAATYHWYVQVDSTSQPAKVLDTLAPYATSFRDGILGSKLAGATQVWMGETGGHSGGGRPGATDSVASGQWYLDSLGMLATLNHSVHCRQDLFGANYGLLDYSSFRAGEDGTTLSPRPDFFTTLVFKKAVGQVVLPAAVTVVPGEGDSVRGYAFCAAAGRYGAGAVAVVAINPSPATVNVSFAGLGDASQPRLDFGFGAPPGGEAGSILLLNGKPLQLTSDRKVPPLDPANSTVGAQLTLATGTYGIFVFPNAGFAACQ
eukprot:m.488122 g.488122  ORF g.488122 m.488122 type:complete len:583 (-) comp25560_c0_seq1:126-1874(-)